jgi:hypothetical protein
MKPDNARFGFLVDMSSKKNGKLATEKEKSEGTHTCFATSSACTCFIIGVIGFVPFRTSYGTHIQSHQI